MGCIRGKDADVSEAAWRVWDVQRYLMYQEASVCVRCTAVPAVSGVNLG
jgi:hypothetical protein